MYRFFADGGIIAKFMHIVASFFGLNSLEMYRFFADGGIIGSFLYPARNFYYNNRYKTGKAGQASFIKAAICKLSK